MIEDYFFTKNTKWVLWGALGILLAMLIFHAGVVAGSHQQRGHVLVGEAGGPGQNVMFFNGMGMSNILPKQDYLSKGHGAVGTIATVTLPTFIINGRDGSSQKIFAASSTVVTGGSINTTAALQDGQFVIIIGDPDDSDDTGYLDARVIHILPPPPIPAQ